jgi:hypothetical protein
MAMTESEEAAVITALHEGILAARNALRTGEQDHFHETLAMAHAALASLQFAGFEIVRKV